MFYKLKYFSASTSGIAGNHLEHPEKTVLINLDLVSEVSELLRFDLPISGKHIGTYAIVMMNNTSLFYIKETSYKELLKVLESKITPFSVNIS